METTAPAPYQFKVADPFFALGVLMYIASRLMDTYYNFPIADLILPLMTFAFAAKDKALVDFGKVPAIIPASLFIVWSIISNFHHGIHVADQLRNLIALITLFLPVFFFILTKNRDALMSYLIGNIVGFLLYFTTLVGLEFAQSGDIPRYLRGEQPTPVVALAMYVLFRKQLTWPIKAVLLAGTVISILVTFKIDARGPLIALPMAVVFFIVVRYSIWPRLAIPAFVAGGLVIHFIASLFNNGNFDLVAGSANDTLSNLERAYAIDYCRMILSHFPWLGDSPQNYAINFSDSFAYIAGFSEEGDRILSPHNSFLEYSVFFGYPAGILFVLTIGTLMYAALREKPFARSFFVALAAAGVIRIGAFYGFSGWLRVEWFALIFAMYYNYQLSRQSIVTAPTVFSGNVPLARLSPQAVQDLARQKHRKA